MKPSETGNAVSRSKVVEFEANTTYEAVTRSGSFIDADDVTVNWSLQQLGKFKVEFIDLGITNSSGKKVLFANANIGAEAEEDYGKYFQWGDTVGYTDASHSAWATAPFNNGSSSYNKTYFASVSASTVTVDSDGNYNLNAEYDAATVAYGEGYRLPTNSEYQLLKANTTSTWTTQNGVNGYKFTSKVDTTKSIFVPAAGYAGGGSLFGQGSRGGVWSSSLDASGPNGAWYLYFSSSYVGMYDDYRRYGYSLRGVLVQN